MKKTSLYLLAASGLLLLCLLLSSFASVSEAAVKHKVKKGDSFYSIAKKYHVKISDLKNANSTAARDMKPGDKIIIPSQKDEARKIARPVEAERDNISYKKTSKENISPDRCEESYHKPALARVGFLVESVKQVRHQKRAQGKHKFTRTFSALSAISL